MTVKKSCLELARYWASEMASLSRIITKNERVPKIWEEFDKLENTVFSEDYECDQCSNIEDPCDCADRLEDDTQAWTDTFTDWKDLHGIGLEKSYSDCENLAGKLMIAGQAHEDHGEWMNNYMSSAGYINWRSLECESTLQYALTTGGPNIILIVYSDMKMGMHYSRTPWNFDEHEITGEEKESILRFIQFDLECCQYEFIPDPAYGEVIHVPEYIGYGIQAALQVLKLENLEKKLYRQYLNSPKTVKFEINWFLGSADDLFAFVQDFMEQEYPTVDSDISAQELSGGASHVITLTFSQSDDWESAEDAFLDYYEAIWE